MMANQTTINPTARRARHVPRRKAAAWYEATHAPRFRVVRETSGSAADAPQNVSIRSPRDAYALLRPYAEQEGQEVVWMIALDRQHRVIGGAPFEITRGTLDTSLVHPREVFRGAIMLNAAAIVLAHNHPSGDPQPSNDDRAVTRAMLSASRVLDIALHDHLVIGDGCYVSFAEQGLL